MIPLRLSLKHFLCYGEGVPTLDLEGIHVACLCGQNGHGKSALLDAMTWALWGKARGRTQDGLIHYGRDEMLVDLEFLARDTRYRATRRHATGGSSRRHGASDLQLQIFAGKDFHPITGNSIRETQAKIDQITGMDYDTFINSAFLLQGRADEFTNKAPGERKEVLGKIIGLGYYDRLQDRLKERASEKMGAASSVEGDLEHMRSEVSRKDGYRRDLEAVDETFKEISVRLDTSKQAFDNLKTRVKELTLKRRELEELEKRIPAIEKDLADLRVEIDTSQRRIAAYQVLLDDVETIQTGLAQYQEHRARYEEISRSRERFDHLMKLKSDLEQTVGAAKARLEEQIKELSRRIEVELRPRADTAPTIGSNLDESRAHLNELTKEEQDIADRRQNLQRLAAQVGQYEATTLQLKAEGQELRSKLSLVQASHRGARCPLCGTDLGSDGCQRLSDSYTSQIEEKLRLYQENVLVLKAVEKEKLSLDSVLPKEEAALRRSQRDALAAVTTLERDLEESRNAAAEMEKVGDQMAQEKHRLEQKQYAADEQGKLEELDAQIAALGYDHDSHQHLYDEMQGLQHFEERYSRLEEAINNLPQEQESLGRAKDMCQRRHDELTASQAGQKDMKAAISELPEQENELKVAESLCQELAGRHGELYRRQIELEGELKRLEALENEIGDKEVELKNLRDEQSIYQELTGAFGKRGIQAMLIETVLPSIEQEANELLGRMTDGRMHVKLETLRERRSGRGEPIETLEIVISDELGPRSYELFSGGEAFRINLALRIALSKVLAHRRGAPLPTLFIDEGFGTQDASGRERIMDVISAIEQDFEKVIVITHLDELKEAFQTRIEVHKEETGSTFRVSY